MKLLYSYILFLDEKGEDKPHRGLHHVELNLSTVDRFIYDASTNTLRRKDRKAPLPAYFWSDTEIKPEDCNIYNVNVIAGENGSGKTTAIRCLINLLDFFHQATYTSRYGETLEIWQHRALLLIEEEEKYYLIDYMPEVWISKGTIKIEGFYASQPQVLSCKSRNAFILSPEHVVKDIEALLKKLKVVYLSNTLTQYDYEHHKGKVNSRQRNAFIYNASIGAYIGRDVDIARFFPAEIYRQAQYVFEPEQEKTRNELREQIGHEITLPHTLRLHLCIEPYQAAFSCTIFPIIGASIHLEEKHDDLIHSKDLGFLTLLGMLCVAAYAKNLEAGMMRKEDFFFLKDLPVETTHVAFSPKQELKKRIQEIAERFYTIRNFDLLNGHHGKVLCLATLSDGRVVSASDDNTLRVWNVFASQCMMVLEGHKDGVTCVAILPGGRMVSGSHDNTLRIWDATTGKCLKTLVGHKDGVTCIAILPDGRVVSGSHDKTLRVWDSTTGQCLQTLEGHESMVSCVAVLPDGRIVSGSLDKTLRVWDSSTGQCLQTLEGHGNMVSCVAILPDGRVISGSHDKTLRVWNASMNHCQITLEGHRGFVTCIAILPDGRVVSGSYDSALLVWDSSTGKCLKALKGYNNGILCVAVLPDGRVVSGSENSILCVWNAFFLKTMKQMRKEMPFAYDLMKKSQDYVDYLYENQEKLFSLFRRIDDTTFELSLDVIRCVPKVKANTKDDSPGLNDITYHLLMIFFQKYISICQPSYTIDFDWGLSMGEESMLRIFSNLYHIFDWQVNGKQKIYNNEPNGPKTECDSVLLFMDEADLTLHPEWQRRLIAILIFFLPRIYPASCVRDMQLILSTHSPLLLGDIPGENITYLSPNDIQEKHQESDCLDPGETFGQNIHTILKESFFLKNGTIGAFAGNKINRIAVQLSKICKLIPVEKDIDTQLDEIRRQIPDGVDIIKYFDDELENIRQNIEIVAQGILRAKLEQMYRVAKAAVKRLQEIIEDKPTMEKVLLEARNLSNDEQMQLITELQKKENK